MAITTRTAVVLERASQEFVDATSTPPFLYELTPAEARKVLDDVQAEPIDKPPVNDRGDVRFVQQSMYYPVTDAAMDTGSYEQFAEGYFLTAKAMAWFWNAYLPDLERRSEPYASPLRASDEQLAGLPPAFVIVDEADVLRDEGEAYAARLRAAGVPVTTVRYDGITHDFMMLNPLSATHATRAAVAQAISILRDALWSA
jgi:acetyl esterase